MNHWLFAINEFGLQYNTYEVWATGFAARQFSKSGKVHEKSWDIPGYENFRYWSE